MKRNLRTSVAAMVLVLAGCTRAAPLSPVSPPSPVSPVPPAGPGPVPASARAVRVGMAPVAPWESFRVERDHDGPLDLHVARDEKPRPVVLLLQGSKCYPLFSYRVKDGARTLVSQLIFSDVAHYTGPPVHFAALERRGIHSFGDRPSERPTCTHEFGGVTKTERVRDVVDAVRALEREPWVKGMLIVGHSEGADVAAGAAKALGDGHVGAVGLFSGAGPTQFFDFVMDARHEGDPSRVQEVFEDMLFVTGPKAEGRYRGTPIERWTTYAIDSTPLDDLRDLRVPVFVVQGTADAKASVEGADLLTLELLRNPARKVGYLLLPDSDHDLMTKDGRDLAGDVMKAFVEWAVGPRRGREVRTGSVDSTHPVHASDEGAPRGP